MWKELPTGTQPFVNLSCQRVIQVLRQNLKKLSIADWELCETKSFRRGHARDLITRPDSTLKGTMRMGEWKSKAVLSYSDMTEIEARAVAESDSDEGP